MPLEIIGLAFAAWVLSLACTPLIRSLAQRVGVVDKPDPQRKLHSGEISLGGGVAVLFASVTALALLFWIAPQLRVALQESAWGLASVGVGAALICVLGFVDDAITLRGRQKLVGQIIIVGVMMSMGLVVSEFKILGYPVDLGVAAIPFTALWLLAAINALNLLDGSDGLASTVGIIASIAVSIMAYLNGNPAVAAVAAALAGGLAGFLVFNFPPATIYLGDAGSMLIGLVLGVLTIQASLKGASVALAAPIALLAIPMFDSSAAVLRRTLTGRSIYTTDRGHLHHSLLSRGLSRKSTLLVVAILCTLTCAGALISVAWNNELFAVITAIVVIAAMVAGRVFGHAEMSLLMHRVLHFGGSLLAKNGADDGFIRQQQVHLQGSRNWDQLWDAISGFARDNQLYRVRLDLNLPWLHEGYNAIWERNKVPTGMDTWQLRVPLAADSRNAGRLVVVGGGAEPPYLLIGRMCRMLEELEPTIRKLCAELPGDDDSSVFSDLSPKAPAWANVPPAAEEAAAR